MFDKKETYGTAVLMVLAACSGGENNATGVEVQRLLNDTGSITCGNAEAGDADCPQPDYPKQDAQFGRDTQAITKVGAGTAGFDWVKINAQGQALESQSQGWDEGGSESAGTRWSCVLDNTTGLTWEVKESDETHPRFGGHTYSWYSDNAQTNGGVAGRPAGGVCATEPCDSQSFVNWVNAQKLCGFDDWRMPNIAELSSIVVVSEVLMAVDESYFPNIPEPRFFTSQSSAHDPGLAWYVYFSDGSVSFTNKGTPSSLRLVRGDSL